MAFSLVAMLALVAAAPTLEGTSVLDAVREGLREVRAFVGSLGCWTGSGGGFQDCGSTQPAPGAPSAPHPPQG